MKHITQFSGSWWTSQDGRQWRRLQGPVARQLAMGFELIQGAIELISDNGEVFTLQSQFVCSKPNEDSLPPAMKKAMRKAVIGASPITDDEITSFSKLVGDNNVFKEPPQNQPS